MKAENFGAVLKTMRTDFSEGSVVEVRPASPAPSNNAEDVADNALSEVRTTIEGLLGLAAKKDLEEGLEGKALEVQVCATLALGLFMPHEQARRGLIALMASEDVPTKIRSAASEAMNNGTDDVSDKAL
jgi:hypothetical protein